LVAGRPCGRDRDLRRRRGRRRLAYLRREGQEGQRSPQEEADHGRQPAVTPDGGEASQRGEAGVPRCSGLGVGRQKPVRRPAARLAGEPCPGPLHPARDDQKRSGRVPVDRLEAHRRLAAYGWPPMPFGDWFADLARYQLGEGWTDGAGEEDGAPRRRTRRADRP
jgi:hypothetical protein